MTQETTKSHSSDEYYEKVRILGESARDSIEDILDLLNVEYRLTASTIKGSCPIHGGDNQSGFTMYLDNDKICGFWRCWTRSCHQMYSADLFGFVQAVLERNSGQKKSYNDGVKYVCSILRTGLSDVSVDNSALEKLKFYNQINTITRERQEQHSQITRSDVRKSLRIPSLYYQGRGISAKVLDQYDVGHCVNYRKRMHGRVVVPIYDDNYEFLIGCTGRSLFPKCEKCSRYHSVSKPCPFIGSYDHMIAQKWLHSSNFNASSYLYNYWMAKDAIKAKEKILLVESPGNVWKLVENGVDYAVATFGAHLTEEQAIILERSGALDVYVLFDNDAAGDEALPFITKRLERSFNIKVLKPCWGGFNDVADMDSGNIKERILSLLKE